MSNERISTTQDLSPSAFPRTRPWRRLAMVDVAVEPAGDTKCEVCVRYRMTSLAPEGDAAVEEFGEVFDGHMATWVDTLEELVQNDLAMTS